MQYAFTLLFLLSTSIVNADTKLPIPSDKELATPRNMIMEIFGEQIKVAKNGEEKSKLASDLIETAKSSASPSEKFALITQAQDLAIAARDLSLSLQAIDMLDKTFQIDQAKLKTVALTKLTENKLNQEIIVKLVEKDCNTKDDPEKNQIAADAWCDIAKKLTSPLEKSARDRAIAYYNAALQDLSGLKKLQVEKKIRECEEGKSKDRPNHAPTSDRYGHGRIIEIDCTKGLNTLEAIKAQRNAARAYGVPVEFTNKIGMRFKFIPAGTFWLGSPQGEPHRDPNEKQQLFKIEKPFYMGITEVTQKEYWQITKQNPSKGPANPNHPVENITEEEARGFCKKLSEMDKERTYFLPTESAWEYASRAGVLSATYGPINKISWSKNTNPRSVKPVAQLTPNAWGLYDCLGNVWEWCEKDDYSTHSRGNIRGSSVLQNTSTHRLANRWYHKYTKAPDIGFRVGISL